MAGIIMVLRNRESLPTFWVRLEAGAVTVGSPDLASFRKGTFSSRAARAAMTTRKPIRATHSKASLNIQIWLPEEMGLMAEVSYFSKALA